MTDHQHLAEGYGDASVPCATKTGVIPTNDERDALRARVKALEEACQAAYRMISETPPSSQGWFTVPAGVAGSCLVTIRAALEARHDQPDQGGGQ